MNTFLPPIEKPASIGMKVAYYFTKKTLGKVITSLKVHSARLPTAFGMFYARVGSLDKRLILPAETALLIRQQVARLNLCSFCIDAGEAVAIKTKMDIRKLQSLEHYMTDPLFTGADRAALDYTTELTVRKHVEQQTFDRLLIHFSEREICEIVYLVASEHLYNITNIGLNIGSDKLCEIARKA